MLVCTCFFFFGFSFGLIALLDFGVIMSSGMAIAGLLGVLDPLLLS